ncbi:hypothetical protein ACHHYP_15363 [Achlya hypogyna]|uniref:Spp2/MOS2 G-patch domain-containing protein n=1 Tax=Achlya hypogyna TaxID=1202772 RepID=A0A1V9YAW8_ACHHY|nr:hypothetical protein ACHHYP_15363 [Achlya hypogyna]
MKVGFSLKGKKKPAVAAVAGGFRVEKEAPQDATKDIVLGFASTGKALLKDPVAAKAQLVIPLIEQNWAEKGASEADSAAATALLADIRATTAGDTAEESTLVIPVAKVIKANDTPILFRNKLPGIENLANENDKFKHDISLRPDDMDIHSDAYEAVPIEEFGAALLRGMGWTGKDRVQPTGSKVQMRHQRLGLGATPKPPMPGDSKKKRGKALDTKPIRLIEKVRDGSRPRDDERTPKATSSTDDRRTSRDRSRDRTKREDSRERRDSRQGSRDSRRGDSRERKEDRDRARSRSRERKGDRDRKRSRSRDRKHR